MTEEDTEESLTTLSIKEKDETTGFVDAAGYPETLDDQLTEFIYRDWDDRAELPIPHFNFIVKLLLPRHLVSKIPEREKKVVQNINERQHATYGDRPSIKCVAVGSAAECYMLPSILYKVPGLQVFLYSDMDVLLEWQLSPLKEFSEASEMLKMTFECKETHPGYARIRINEADKMFKNGNPSYFIKVGEKYYLSAKKQRDDRFEDLQSEVLLDSSGYAVDTKGPAVAVEDSTKLTSAFISSLNKLQIRQELVTAVPCNWPSVARKWKTRQRETQWLSPALLDSVMEDGCHLVPVAHKHSKCPDIEWRISFATTEVQLANKVITAEQRQCYIYLKLLRQIMMKDKSLISSYHCKTVFLYSCERLPLEAWGDNPGLCVLYMLDTLLHFVQHKYLPSYFIPENNLIDNFTETEFEVCENILLAARIDPIGQVLQFTDNHVIGDQTVSESFRELIALVINDITKYKVHKNVQISVDSFINALLKVVYANLLENKISAAVAYSLDLSRFFTKYFPDNDINYYLLCVFADVRLTMQLVQIFEKILCFSKDYPEVTGLRGHLATLYHCASFNFKSNSPCYRETIEKANNLFIVLQETDTASPVVLDYAYFLLSTGKTTQAEDILRHFLTSDRDCKSLQNRYNDVTYIILEPNLRNEIQSVFQKSKIVAIPSEPLAFNLYLKCLSDGGENTSMEQTVFDFERACKQSGNGWSYFLLGLSLMDLEQYQQAESIFLTAVKLFPKFQLNLRTKAQICHVQHLLLSDNVKEAVQYLIQIAKRVYKHITVVQYLNFMALSLSKLCYTVELFKEMMNLADEFPEMVESRGNMACIYHAFAYEFEEESDEYLTAMIQADTLFHTHVIEGGNKLSTKVDYCMFLCSQSRWADVVELIGDPLDMDICCKDRNSYGLLEIKRLDENLKEEIKVHGQFDANAPAFAFHLYIKSALKLEKTAPVINSIVEGFKNYCQSEKHARSYALLGYTYMMMNRFREAELSFCKAVVYCRTYSMAKQNIQKCREKAKEAGQSQLDIRKLGVSFCLIPELEGNCHLDFETMFK